MIDSTTITVYVCDRCAHRWAHRSPLDESLRPLPRVCPSCKSPYWNVPRKSP